MAFFPIAFVHIPPNKMVVSNVKFITFLIPFVHFSYLPLCLNVFWVKRLLLLSTPSIVFPHLLLIINPLLSFFMPDFQTIHLFASLVVSVLSPFPHMNEINSSLGLTCVVFSSMGSLKRVYVAMITSLVAFVSPFMWNSRNIKPSLVVNIFPLSLPL
jgi:hypothetical protein